MTDNVSRKPAPPIPKKPAILSSSPSSPVDQSEQNLSPHQEGVPKKKPIPSSSITTTTAKHPTTTRAGTAEEEYIQTSINARIQQLGLSGSGSRPWPGRHEGSYKTLGSSMANPDNGPALPPRRESGSITATTIATTTNNNNTSNTSTGNQNKGSNIPVTSNTEQQAQSQQALLDANDTDMRNSLKSWKPLQPD